MVLSITMNSFEKKKGVHPETGKKRMLDNRHTEKRDFNLHVGVVHSHELQGTLDDAGGGVLRPSVCDSKRREI